MAWARDPSEDPWRRASSPYVTHFQGCAAFPTIELAPGPFFTYGGTV